MNLAPTADQHGLTYRNPSRGRVRLPPEQVVRLQAYLGGRALSGHTHRELDHVLRREGLIGADGTPMPLAEQLHELGALDNFGRCDDCDNPAELSVAFNANGNERRVDATCLKANYDATGYPK